MASEELLLLSLTELSRLLREKITSPVELVEAYLKRIEALDPKLHAYITVFGEKALEQARVAEKEILRGHTKGPMQGIPVGVKDQLQVDGCASTYGSYFTPEIAQDDSTVVAHLKESGAIILGKHNMSEFAMGGNLRFPYGTPHNPWNPEHEAGHSSGGSAVAVAASLCAGAVGEDTGGSIRIPASWCGITGLRPTWGRVSRYGMLGVAWFMDQAGPIAKTAEDCALIFESIAGHDPKDPYTSKRPSKLGPIVDTIAGLRIGVIKESMDSELLDPEVGSSLGTALEVLASAGANLTSVSVPLFSSGGLISATVTDVNGSFLHRKRLQTAPDKYDPASKSRLLAGSIVPAQWYERALRLRILMARQINKAMEDVDVLITPTMFSTAPKIQATSGLDSKEKVFSKFFAARGGTGPFNLAALPALSIPCGFTTAGLPIGMQIAGRAFDEATILRVGHGFQQHTKWHSFNPPL